MLRGGGTYCGCAGVVDVQERQDPMLASECAVRSKPHGFFRRRWAAVPACSDETHHNAGARRGAVVHAEHWKFSKVSLLLNFF